MKLLIGTLLAAAAAASVPVLRFEDTSDSTNCRMRKSGQAIVADCDLSNGQTSLSTLQAYVDINTQGIARNDRHIGGHAYDLRQIHSAVQAQATENSALRALISAQSKLITDMRSDLDALATQQGKDTQRLESLSRGCDQP